MKLTLTASIQTLLEDEKLKQQIIQQHGPAAWAEIEKKFQVKPKKFTHSEKMKRFLNAFKQDPFFKITRDRDEGLNFFFVSSATPLIHSDSEIPCIIWAVGAWSFQLNGPYDPNLGLLCGELYKELEDLSADFEDCLDEARANQLISEIKEKFKGFCEAYAAEEKG